MITLSAVQPPLTECNSLLCNYSLNSLNSLNSVVTHTAGGGQVKPCLPFIYLLTVT